MQVLHSLCGKCKDFHNFTDFVEALNISNFLHSLNGKCKGFHNLIDLLKAFSSVGALFQVFRSR